MPLCYQNQVWPPLAEQGHQEVTENSPLRLPMVSMSRASESLVGAWANSCRVRGRLSLLMVARPKSSKACSIGSISREQVGHGTSTGPYASRNYFPAAAMGKRSRLAAECCFHKFFLGVEDRGFPECPATWRRWRFHPEPPMTFFLPYEYRPIPPLSRHHNRAGSWIQ